MRLPDGNGLDFVKDVQAEKPDLPVAVISAPWQYGFSRTSFKAGRL